MHIIAFHFHTLLQCINNLTIFKLQPTTEQRPALVEQKDGLTRAAIYYWYNIQKWERTYTTLPKMCQIAIKYTTDRKILKNGMYIKHANIIHFKALKTGICWYAYTPSGNTGADLELLSFL
jgi:hypothetical protein